MKAYIFKIDSMVKDGWSQAGALNLMYTMLLQKYGMDVYSFISIHQIGTSLDELILKEGKRIHLNFRYPATPGYAEKPATERLKIQLETAHAGLLEIAAYEKKLDTAILETIRQEMLAHNFDFTFTLKEYVHKKEAGLVAKLMVHPLMDVFDYYVQVEHMGVVQCKVKIYCSITDLFDYFSFFKTGKWTKAGDFILTGTEKVVETYIKVKECKVEYINLTPYSRPPQFHMSRLDISKEEREEAYQEWKESNTVEGAAALAKRAVGSTMYKKVNNR